MRELENKIIYQIYPKSYLDTTGNGFGDLQGIISKLDYIKSLSVDYIWLSPCLASPQKDNGYDISNYEMIDPLFGTNDDYLKLIEEANKRDMKIMMDLVLNHTSDKHEWFQRALKHESKYMDYYIWRDEPNELESVFGGSAWTYSDCVGKYYLHFFDKSQPDLNWENPEVREELYAMINRWIEKGVQGFRLDVIDMIGKDPDKLIGAKGPKYLDYLYELSDRTFKDKILTVGECWGSTLEETLAMCNEKGLTQSFHFHQHTLTDVSDKWHQRELELHELVTIFETWQNEYTGIEAIVMNNHDQPRLLSKWFDDIDNYELQAKLLITVFGMLRGNLYLYQGEEIGMASSYREDISFYQDVETLNYYESPKKDPSVMKRIQVISRDNARVPMQWTASNNAGFTQSKPWIAVNESSKFINVEEQEERASSVLNYYREFLRFRKENYEDISSKMSFYSHGNTLSMENESFKLIANFGKSREKLEDEYSSIFATNSKKDMLDAYEFILYKK